MSELLVVKRDCSEQAFDESKIYNAIMKAMKNGSGIIKPKIAESIAKEIHEECKNKESVDISDIELMVFDKLITKKQRLTARAYEGYRSTREFQRENNNTTDDDVIDLVNGNNDYLMHENANKNPVLNTTVRDYMAGIVSIADDNGGLQYTINYFTSKFGGINKVNRQIPNEIFSWNYEAKLAFLAGMIDADGYINSHQNEKDYSTIQIGSTNKELALGQMALAQSLGMPARIYHNHYTKKNPELIRYRVEFYPNDELINHIVCKKKCDNYIESSVSGYTIESEIIKIIPVHKKMYSYDVTTSSAHFEVSGIYSHNCRSFLTVDSLYGTPLESTTYKFAKSLKNRFGKDVFVKIDGKDRNYITNSYHIPVFEPITAFEKLRIESKFQKLSPGGAISYIEIPSMTHNIPAILEVIKFIYNNIMYAEINTKNCYCEKCGFDGDIPLVDDEDGILKWKCPNCGNTDNTTMDIAFRVCGYIGTAKNGGNQGRYGDIHDRVYHLDDTEYEE